MKVFKFGGSSVKNAEGVKNILAVLKTTEEKDLVVIVSAMGKMTNQLELIVSNYFSNPNEVKVIHQLRFTTYHFQIISDLFSNTSHPIFNLLLRYKNELQFLLGNNKSTDHSYVYDQAVSFGELISTSIISAYLSDKGLENKFLDVRSCIKTNTDYRDAIVDWEETQKNIIEMCS